MRKVRNPKVGQLVQVPIYEFTPHRAGWNGWIFRVGVIDKLYISKSGKRCATVRYCSGRAGRYQLLPCTEHSKNFLIDQVFAWDRLDIEQKFFNEAREIEKSGERVCWSEDTAFLLNNGFIKAD